VGRRTERSLARRQTGYINSVVDTNRPPHSRNGPLDTGLASVESGDPRLANLVVLDWLRVTHGSRDGAVRGCRLGRCDGGGAKEADEGEELHGGDCLELKRRKPGAGVKEWIRERIVLEATRPLYEVALPTRGQGIGSLESYISPINENQHQGDSVGRLFHSAYPLGVRQAEENIQGGCIAAIPSWPWTISISAVVAAVPPPGCMAKLQPALVRQAWTDWRPAQYRKDPRAAVVFICQF
jgi:hypothetical protein